MPDDTHNLTPQDDSLDGLLAEYVAGEDAGHPQDRQAILARNPRHAAELREFFANRDQMRRLAAPLRGGEGASSNHAEGHSLGKLRYFGDYELLEEIAAGGMGIVYKARQVSLNRVVAVKMMLKGTLASEDDVKRFRAEAEAAASLQHPAIVAIHEVGLHEGQHYFSMDFVDGRSLAELPRAQQLSARQSGEYLRDAAEAVHYAHEQGTLHRDLKPSNILIDRRGRVRITDFGLAKKIAGNSDLTLTGQVLGTPSYMPPEQAQGKRTLVAAASDVYSLGAVLYELLTGRPPFRGESPVETLRQVETLDPVAPRLLNPAVPRDLETICLKCLEKEPHKRYGTAQQLADDLGRYLRGEPIVARPVSRPARAWRWCRRNPLLVSIGAAANISIVAVLLVVTIAYLRESSLRLDLLNEQETTKKALRASQFSVADLRKHSGLTAAERGDAAAAAVWFAGAAEILGEDHPRAQDSRLRATIWNDVAPRPVQAVMHPEDWVMDVKFHPSGKYLLTWSPHCGPHQGRCIVWDLETERELPLTVKGGQVCSASWNCDGSILALGTDRGQLLLQKFPAGDTEHDIALEERTDFLEFDPTGRYLAMAYGAREKVLPTDRIMKTGKKVRVWDLQENRFSTPELLQSAPVSTLTFHPSGTQLVVGNSQSTCWAFAIPTTSAEPLSPKMATHQVGPSIAVGERPARPIFLERGRRFLTFDGLRCNLWDTASWTSVPLPPKAAPLMHPPDVTALSPNEQVVVTGLSGGVTLLATNSFQQRLLRPNRTRQKVFVTAVSPNGRHLLSAGAERMTRIWTLPDARPVGPPIEHPTRVLAGAWSGDGRRFATAEHGGLVRVWALGPNSLNPVPLNPPGGLALLSPSGKYVVSQGSTFIDTGPSRTRVDSTADGRPAGPVIEAGGQLLGAAFSPDERELAILTGGADALTLLDWRTGEVRQPMLPLESQPRCVCYRPGGDEIGVLLANGQVVVVNSATISVRAQWSNQVAYPRNNDFIWNGALEFAPDGESLITYQTDRAVRVWNVRDGSLRYRIDEHLDRCVGVALSRDGARLATASFDHSARVWDFTTGRPLSSSLIHADKVHSVNFHPQGEFLVTTNRDGQARVWEWRTGKLACPPLPHDHEVHTAAFTPDGRFVITASEDGKARVWEYVTGKPLSPPLTLHGAALNLEITPDGRRLVVGGFASGRLNLVSLDALFDTDPLDIHDRRLFAELCAGRFLDSTGGLTTLTCAEWHAKWKSYRSGEPPAGVGDEWKRQGTAKSGVTREGGDH